MTDLVAKYNGRKLSTDELAEARNAIEAEIKRLEAIDYSTSDDYILLKWGTLKAWNIHSIAGKKILEKFFKLGVSASAMNQKNTHEQKQLICQLIDDCDGIIQNDWEGNYYTKQQAKEYVMEYSI